MTKELPHREADHLFSIDGNKYLGYKIVDDDGNAIDRNVYGSEVLIPLDIKYNKDTIDNGMHHYIPMPIIYYDVKDGEYLDSTHGTIGMIKDNIKVGDWLGQEISKYAEQSKYTYHNGRLVKHLSGYRGVVYVNTYKDGWLIEKTQITKEGQYLKSYNRGMFEGPMELAYYQGLEFHGTYNTKIIGGKSMLFGPFEFFLYDEIHRGTFIGNLESTNDRSQLQALIKQNKSGTFVGEYTVTGWFDSKPRKVWNYDSCGLLDSFQAIYFESMDDTDEYQNPQNITMSLDPIKVLSFYSNGHIVDISEIILLIQDLCFAGDHLPEVVVIILEYL